MNFIGSLMKNMRGNLVSDGYIFGCIILVTA